MKNISSFYNKCSSYFNDWKKTDFEKSKIFDFLYISWYQKFKLLSEIIVTKNSNRVMEKYNTKYKILY